MTIKEFCANYAQLSDVAHELEAHEETMDTYGRIMACATREHPVPYELGMRVEEGVPYYCQSMDIAFTAKMSGVPYGLTDTEYFDFCHD